MRNILGMGLLFAAAGTFVAAQIGTDQSGPAKTYVGKLAKGPGGAMIGVVTEGEEVLAYLCSNDDAFNGSHARWFRGTVGKQGKFEIEVDGAKLVGTLAAGKIEGTVTGSDNQTLAFTATAIQQNGAAGLFRAETYIGKDHYVVGWVRNDDGATVGAAAKNGKQAILEKQPSPKAKTAPGGAVGLGKNTKALTGTLVDNLGFPLPGQLAAVTIVAIDAKKNQLTVKNKQGKNFTVPGDRVTFTGRDGKSQLISLAKPPTEFQEQVGKETRGFEIIFTTICTKRDPKTNRCIEIEVDFRIIQTK